MKQKDVFLIIVRGVGLVTLLYGIDAVLEGILFSTGLGSDDRYSARYWGVRGVVQIIAGLFLMRGARPILAFAFPEEAGTAQQEVPEASHKNETPLG